MKKIVIQRTGDSRVQAALAADLNPAQLAAATAPDGFNLVLAGPGSGKTRVITYRVAHLLSRGVPASSILLATFTRRAAREMVARLEGLVGPSASGLWAGTFHHLGNRILRRAAGRVGLDPNFTILDSEDQSDLMKLAIDDAGLVGTGRYAPRAPAVLGLVSFAFNAGLGLEETIALRAPDWLEWTGAIVAAAAAYEKHKRASNCVDYDDLLKLWARLVADDPEERGRQASQFRHVLVDELQDTNRIQIHLVEGLARAGAGNLTAVGDDAQSIYRFRGADYANILEFPDRNPGARVFRLETNYRSTPEIVALVNDSIRNNRSGFPKTLVSSRGSGARPVLAATEDAYEEADLVCQLVLDARDEGVGLGRIAVLYRNHQDSILTQAALVERGIPYVVRSGIRFFEQAHVKDVLAHLRIHANPRDEAAWRRVLTLLPGFGAARSGAIFARLAAASDPMAELETAGTMKDVPAKSRGAFAGFVADVRRVRAVDPAAHPSRAIGAILEGGYKAVVRSKYDRADNRLADLEQLAVLADRFDSLERFLAELLLAGDMYGRDTMDADGSDEALVLSTVHQAKGLEWSRVIVIRLVEDGFPSGRSLREPDGEEEERRIFYVAASRAMDELVMTYPLVLSQPGRGGSVIARPSRFVTELDPALYDQAEVETDASGEGPEPFPPLI
jgi:DNA helicase-2/ATP-dependent DNA helicase PcrA